MSDPVVQRLNQFAAFLRATTPAKASRRKPNPATDIEIVLARLARAEAAARSPSAPTGEGRLREALVEARDLLQEGKLKFALRRLEAALAAPSDPPPVDPERASRIRQGVG